VAQLVVRDLDNEVKKNLRSLAARHGHSMEEEVRLILSAAACENPNPPKKLGTWVAGLFKNQGLDRPIAEQRGQPVKPAQFE